MEFYQIQTEHQARELCKIMPEVVAIDTEYVKGDPRTTQLLSVIVADSERAWAILPSLLPILTPTIRARKLVFLQDYSHCDTIILLKHGCDLRETNCHNLIDMHHLLDENAEHDLGTRVSLQFGDNYKQEFWSKYDNFEDAPEDEALEYQCKDAIYTFRLGLKDAIFIWDTLNKNIRYLYEHIRKLSASLLETEINGLCVNEELMHETEKEMREQIEESIPRLREEFKEYCELWELEKWSEEIEKRKSDKGRLAVPRPKFSFESDQQVQWLIYEGLGCTVVEKTKKGNPSTSYDTLKALSESDIRIKSIVEYKDVKGVYVTFVKGMIERVKDGRIYPHFNVSGTTTGRISHSDPNMGNLPKKGRIRNFFIPSPGMVLIGADYEQLEVVVELNLTEDPGLKEIVLGGASKHDLFKAELDKAGFNLPRGQVKNVNFALQYDAQAPKIAKMVGCSVSDAQRIIEVFYNKFNGVKRVKAETSALLAREGAITNLAGRTRHFKPSSNKFDIAKQQRQAYNFLIQGVAGEACNRAFYRFANELKSLGWGRALFSVHDEIVAEVRPAYSDLARDLLIFHMEQSTKDFGFKYPLKAKSYGPLDCWAKT